MDHQVSSCEKRNTRHFVQKPTFSHFSSALNPTCQLLIPNLLSAEVFPLATAICVHLLELDGDEEGLQGLRMEIEDLALHLLHQVLHIYFKLKQIVVFTLKST